MPPRKMSVVTTNSFSVSSLQTAHASLSPLSEQSPTSSHTHTHTFGFQLAFGVGTGVAIFLFLVVLLFHRLKFKWKQNRALTEYPQNSPIKLRNFGYGELRTATQGFGDAHKLGQGGFGAVYKGILKGGEEVAVKKLDVASCQGEREFQNELSVIGHVCVSSHIVGLVGFCVSGKKRLLVYEYMHNRSLQEALFDEGYHAQLCWARRFDIIVETCKALAFLHGCKPPIIHGDIKPSNVLLDANFCAKVADFGLARFKTSSRADDSEADENSAYVEKCKLRRQRRYADKKRKQRTDVAVVCGGDAKGLKAQQQVEPLSVECYARRSVSSIFTTSPDSDASSIAGTQACELAQNSKDGKASQHDPLPSDQGLATDASTLHKAGSELLHSSTKNCAGSRMRSVACKLSVQERANPDMGTDAKAIQSEGEKLSDNNNGVDGELIGGPCKEKRRGTSGQDCWWRQDMSMEMTVKDYVMDWMGYDSRKDAPGMANEACLDGANRLWKGHAWRRELSRSSDLWGGSSQEEGAGQPSSENSSSSRSKRYQKERPKSREWWKDEEVNSSKDWKASKKKRERSLSRDWSGELCSRGVSSTPSMRGTICYVAPENGNNRGVSEKSDVYSFGVLLLVIISGRRPLQVMASPIIEFERANLISWARHLAYSGGILDLVDPSLQGQFCRKQATLSITVALHCLQRLPSKRPSMNEVLKMLSGEMEVPSLPPHFSPSPPCRVRYRSRGCSLSSEGATVDSSISS